MCLFISRIKKILKNFPSYMQKKAVKFLRGKVKLVCCSYILIKIRKHISILKE